MRIVADTNVIVSAFLWGGTPRRLLDAAEAQRVELFTSRARIAELEEVLARAKFGEQLKQTRFSAAYLLARYTQLATLIAPADPPSQPFVTRTIGTFSAARLPRAPRPSSAATRTCFRSAPTRTSA